MRTEDNSGKKVTVLAVDDRPENLVVLEADLAEAGYEVITAEGGAEALEKLRKESIDLVLLDVAMPKVDGLEVCSRIRKNSDLVDLPVILVTARDAPKEVAEGLDAGANDYVTKPIQPQVLLARIRTQLRLKQMQSRLKSTIAELEQLQQLRSDFVAMVTHDMKAPLTSIIGFSGMLKDGAFGQCPSKPFLEAVQNIYRNSTRMKSLIQDFLTFSRIEAGKLEFQFEPVDLDLLLQQIISLMEYQAREKNISLHFDSPEKIKPVRGDRSQIDRAVTNVLTNAIQYSPEGREVEIKLIEMDSALAVKIRDQGPGIPDELLPSLFDRYFRVKAPKKVEGTGLGLSIVKSIVEAHGGRVEVKTAVGKGTTFRLIFPLWQPEES